MFICRKCSLECINKIVCQVTKNSQSYLILHLQGNCAIPEACLFRRHSCQRLRCVATSLPRYPANMLMAPRTFLPLLLLQLYHLSLRRSPFFTMAPSTPAPAQTFSFTPHFLKIRSRGIDTHPYLPDTCPKDSSGLPVFDRSINHLLPNFDDARGVLRFFGLTQTTIREVLNLDVQDSKPHNRQGEAVLVGNECTFPFAQRLFELYARRRITEGSYEQYYGTCTLCFNSVRLSTNLCSPLYLPVFVFLLNAVCLPVNLCSSLY